MCAVFTLTLRKDMVDRKVTMFNHRKKLLIQIVIVIVQTLSSGSMSKPIEVLSDIPIGLCLLAILSLHI